MPDFLASLLIFGTVVGVFFASYQGIVANQAEFQSEKKIRNNAIYATTFLVSTPGYPDNWEEESVDVQIAGLAKGDNVIDRKKFMEFKNLSYERQRQLVDATDFYLELRNDTSRINISGTEYWTGKNFTEAAEEPATIVPITRSVILESSKGPREATLRYISWR